LNQPNLSKEFLVTLFVLGFAYQFNILIGEGAEGFVGGSVLFCVEATPSMNLERVAVSHY
jgi:hypothetical protein